MGANSPRGPPLRSRLIRPPEDSGGAGGEKRTPTAGPVGGPGRGGCRVGWGGGDQGGEGRSGAAEEAIQSENGYF
jgi:hypothetical protein